MPHPHPALPFFLLLLQLVLPRACETTPPSPETQPGTCCKCHSLHASAENGAQSGSAGRRRPCLLLPHILHSLLIQPFSQRGQLATQQLLRAPVATPASIKRVPFHLASQLWGDASCAVPGAQHTTYYACIRVCGGRSGAGTPVGCVRGRRAGEWRNATAAQHNSKMPAPLRCESTHPPTHLCHRHTVACGAAPPQTRCDAAGGRRPGRRHASQSPSKRRGHCRQPWRRCPAPLPATPAPPGKHLPPPAPLRPSAPRRHPLATESGWRKPSHTRHWHPGMPG